MPLYNVVFAFLVFLSCLQYPTELKNKRVADCSHATIPSNYKPDSAKIYLVLEIYDFQQKLINYLETSNSISLLQMNIFWNGVDSDGKIVDPGKYLAKISTISIKDTSCKCEEVFIAK